MNVRIYIIGINHWDPLGRSKIEQLLLNLKIEHNFIPDCIAVEWGQDCFREVFLQRQAFRDMAKELFPNLNESQYETLVLTQGYEADSHLPIYPNIPIVWLDKERDVDTRMIDICRRFAYKTKVEYIANFMEQGKDPKIVSSLHEISAVQWNSAQNLGVQPRDEIFYKHTCDVINSGYRNMVSIVGASHAYTQTVGSYGNLIAMKYSVTELICHQ